MSVHSVKCFSDTQTFARFAAEYVADELDAVISETGKAVLAVPGGSTARIVLPVLFSVPLQWKSVTVALTDERWVPPDHRDSNEGLVRLLIAGTAAETANFAGLFDPRVAPVSSPAPLIQHWQEPDVVLLGMGEDGHIASLFPHDAANRSPAPLATVSRPDHLRVTLTPPVLAHARKIVVAFTGPAKTIVFERAVLDGTGEDLPVRHALMLGAQVLIGP